MKWLKIVLISSLFCGCSVVPKNKVYIQAPDGTVWSFAGSKDTAYKNVSFSVEKNGTTAKFSAESIVATNSPQVLDSSAQAVVNEINALSNLMGTIAKEAAK